MIGKMDLPRGKRTKSGKITDFITICKGLQPDFKGVFRLFIDIGGELNKGVLLISNNETVAVSLRNIDGGTEISGNDALNQVSKHILASVGDLDIYSYNDSEMNLALNVNRHASLTHPLDLGEFQREFALGEGMKENVVEEKPEGEEPGEEKPEEKVKERKKKPKEEKEPGEEKPEEKVKRRRKKPKEEKKPEEKEIRERKDYVSQDALEEVNAIAARHLNTLLSTMIDKKVEMEGIRGGIFPLNKIPRSLRFKNELIAGIYLQVGDEIKASSMLLFPRNSALSLVDIKRGQKIGTTRVLTREDRSILRELGGVVIFSYMNTLSDFLDINLQFSAPSIAFDMANSITRFMLSTIPSKISHILLLKTDFLCGGKKEIRATFILLLDKKSTNFLLKKINRKKRG